MWASKIGRSAVARGATRPTAAGTPARGLGIAGWELGFGEAAWSRPASRRGRASPARSTARTGKGTGRRNARGRALTAAVGSVGVEDGGDVDGEALQQDGGGPGAASEDAVLDVAAALETQDRDRLALGVDDPALGDARLGV